MKLRVEAPHLLRLRLGRDYVGLDIECPGGHDRHCHLFETHRCTCPCEMCTVDEDHGSCTGSSTSDPYADLNVVIDGEFRYPCQRDHIDGCALLEYDMSHEELLHGPDVWDLTEYPVRALVDWQNDYPALVPYAEGSIDWEASE